MLFHFYHSHSISWDTNGRYADNILKGFATSISIIVSAIASVFIFNFKVSLYFVVGACLVLYATMMYGRPDKEHVVLPRVSIDIVEQKEVDDKLIK